MVQLHSLPTGGAKQLFWQSTAKGARQGRGWGEVSEFLKVVSFLSLLSTLSLLALSPFLRISVLSPSVTLITPAPIRGSKERHDVVGGRGP